MLSPPAGFPQESSLLRAAVNILEKSRFGKKWSALHLWRNTGCSSRSAISHGAAGAGGPDFFVAHKQVRPSLALHLRSFDFVAAWIQRIVLAQQDQL